VDRIVKYVKRTKAKGRWYYYFDTGQTGDDGKRIWMRLPDPKERRFAATYAALLGHRTKRENVNPMLTVERLIALYQTSTQFDKLKPATRSIYARYQAEFVDKLGSGPAQRVERKDIVLMLDMMASKPAAANMVLKASSAAYTWARQRGHVTNDPFADIDAMDVGEHQPWPETLIEAALKSDNDEVRLAVHLLYFTAQRIGDVVAMRWGDIEGDRITITQAKTGKRLELPLHSELATELARHPRTLATIVGGKPNKYRIDTIRVALQSFAAEHGHKVVPHGLRKNAVNALLEAGCSAAETAAISGQSLQMVEFYAKLRSQTKLGQSAILKWQRNR
jgi:integrase